MAFESQRFESRESVGKRHKNWLESPFVTGLIGGAAGLLMVSGFEEAEAVRGQVELVRETFLNLDPGVLKIALGGALSAVHAKMFMKTMFER